ncbi:DER1-domain-containing protein [Neocallimastix lanati (nom. inval.)]|jgi:hypothetical protein|nr:DER1-domain-containing protein [Neocallimastix sp. JGI-2020a]
MPLPLEQWYLEIPIVTRVYLTLVALTSFACTLDLIKPIQLYFNWNLILHDHEVWRLITSFLYFGNFSIDFIFHMFFISRYSRMLEEGSFRGRTADYFWLLMLGVISFIIVIPIFTARSQFLFLSTPLTFMLVYIWSRRNPQVRMSFLGILNFNAPYLPWVLLGFTIILNNIWPAGDILGLIIGHIYYFLEDVYPKLFNLPVSYHMLGAPKFVKKTFDYLMRDTQDANLMDDDDIDNIDSDTDQEDLNTPATTTIHNEGGFVLGGEEEGEDEKKRREKDHPDVTGETSSSSSTNAAINQTKKEEGQSHSTTESTKEEIKEEDNFTSNTETNASQPNISSDGLKKRTFVPDFNPTSEPGGYRWNNTEAPSTTTTDAATATTTTTNTEEEKKDI